jgi:HSP20 family protein
MSRRQDDGAILGIRAAYPNRTLIHHESRPENFRRTFELDPSIDADKISAKVDQGLVTLTLPKAEHVKPRKITVS